MTPVNQGAGPGGRRRVAGERGRDRAPVAPASEPPSSSTSRPQLRKGPTPDRKTAAVVPAKAPARRDPPVVATGGSPRPSALRVGLLALLVLLTVAAVTAAVVVLAVDRRQQQLSDARTAATEAARSAAEVVLAYDYETLDDDFAAAEAVSTGTFKEEYAETSENAIRSVATQAQAQVSADPLSAGVVSATPDEVVVLLFVDQTTLSNRLDQPQTDQNRVRFTMVRTAVDGQNRWLVSEVDAL